MIREGTQDAALRWRKLELLQRHYTSFDLLLEDVMALLGFRCTDIQHDIGVWLDTGPNYLMVQAQRGQAKTTVTAAYAVYLLIHNPANRILIVSAGDSLAKEIANLIIQIINGMDELECLRPDASSGDRSSISAFDVHHSLKGVEKSPSVRSVAITANMQGFRADLLIADDIESSRNSATEKQREKLRHLTKDFTSICSKGRIIYLGTPQSVDSVYNSLPSRGYAVRIWPGRYPTEVEEQNYGNALAPIIVARMRNNPDLRTGGGPTGERGRAVDPIILSEEDLTKKEIDQGAAYFQLQHMLDTRLMDADRYPLKPEKIVFMRIPQTRVPLTINWIAAPEKRILPPTDFPVEMAVYEASSYSDEWADFQGVHMYVDPAGKGRNADELACVVTKFQSGTIYLVDVEGMPGGLEDTNLDAIAALAEKWKPNHITIEDNFGAGTFRQVLTPRILKKHKCGIEGVWETGQKELRIIDTLEPLIGSQRLVIDTALLEKDWAQCRKYGVDVRNTYSLFFQLARCTRERGALAHDDRLDALAGSCRYWAEMLAIDKQKELAKARQADYDKMMRNPLGNGVAVPGYKPTTGQTIFDRFLTRR